MSGSVGTLLDGTWSVRTGRRRPVDRQIEDHVFGPQNVRVNAVAPGPTLTPTLETKLTMAEEFAKTIPLGRVADVQAEPYQRHDGTFLRTPCKRQRARLRPLASQLPIGSGPAVRLGATIRCLDPAGARSDAWPAVLKARTITGLGPTEIEPFEIEIEQLSGVAGYELWIAYEDVAEEAFIHLAG